MSLISPSPYRLSSRGPHLPGTAHRGPEWKSAVGILRTALQNAVAHVNWLPTTPADEIALRIIDHIDELDSRGRHVLTVVLGILARQCRKDE